MGERVRKIHFVRWILLVVLLAIAGVMIWGYFNWQWVMDFYRGMNYQPAGEMARIMKDLKLTERGEFLFKASQPELDESGEFNRTCLTDAGESAVLGCYTNDTIHVYNITDAELDGIRELTTAHELLHANYARMSEEEKKALVEPLTRTFEANQGFLGEETDLYDTSQKQEELYVRAGTEVADLPAELEAHYAEIFTNQDMVVAYYNKYISVFRELEAELEALEAEIAASSAEIKTRMANYEAGLAQLNADIVSFNSCAETAGCFTQAEFDSVRAGLIGREEALDAEYEVLNSLIDTHNAKVEQYNADVMRGQNLNSIINSNSKPREIDSVEK